MRGTPDTKVEKLMNFLKFSKKFSLKIKISRFLVFSKNQSKFMSNFVFLVFWLLDFSMYFFFSKVVEGGVKQTSNIEILIFREFFFASKMLDTTRDVIA